jgi:hypothetical protein
VHCFRYVQCIIQCYFIIAICIIYFSLASLQISVSLASLLQNCPSLSKGKILLKLKLAYFVLYWQMKPEL